MPKKKIYSIFIILSVFLADFLTKTIAINKLLLYKSEPVTSFMNFTLAFNYGAAFSFLSDAGGWQRWFFIFFSITVIFVIIYLLIKENFSEYMPFSLLSFWQGHWEIFMIEFTMDTLLISLNFIIKTSHGRYLM